MNNFRNSVNFEDCTYEVLVPTEYGYDSSDWRQVGAPQVVTKTEVKTVPIKGAVISLANKFDLEQAGLKEKWIEAGGTWPEDNKLGRHKL